jgi:hypothetical protein
MTVLADLFHRITRPPVAHHISASPPQPNAMFATQIWLVTWQRQNGGIETSTVLICGVWRMAEIETTARDALHRQHDLTGVQILRLSLDFNMTPARLDALQTITTQYQKRLQFEEGCG